MAHDFPEDILRFARENDGRFPIRHKASESPREILYGSGLPYLPIADLNVPSTEMYLEALALESLAVGHRAEYGEHRGWKSLVLHGLGATKTQGAERYGLNPEDQSIYHWTEIADRCPVTTAFLRNTLAYEAFQRVRFMYLEPGGYVAPHKDAETYYLGPTNIALNQPTACRFVMEGVGVVPFRPGSVIKLALCNRHIVINESDELRIHMIVHGAPDMRLWDSRYRNSYGRLRHELDANGLLANQ